MKKEIKAMNSIWFSDLGVSSTDVVDAVVKVVLRDRQVNKTSLGAFPFIYLDDTLNKTQFDVVIEHAPFLAKFAVTNKEAKKLLKNEANFMETIKDRVIEALWQIECQQTEAEQA